MKSSIIGGGIGGLSTALALQKQGIDFELYEAAQELKPVGAGIILSPNALYIFDQLGILNELEDAGIFLHQFGIKTAQDKPLQIASTKFSQHGKSYQSIGIHRGELQRILLAKLPEHKIHLGKMLRKLEPSSTTLEFEDGKTVKADFVIAADGIHSTVRQTLFPETTLRYSGQSCWRGVADITLSEAELENTAEFWGIGPRFGYVPIAQNKVYWYATAVQPKNQKDTTTHGSKKKLLKNFQSFTNPITRILETTPAQNIMQHDLYDITPLSKWHHKNTVLLGDAAHAMTPNMGQGAAQSIEDAWSISQQLNKHTTLEKAFQAYSNDRFKKANQIAKLSWRIGQITNLQNTFLCNLRNTAMKLTPKGVSETQRQKLFSVPNYL